MRIIHYCEYCNREFNDLEQCIKHEENCNPIVTMTCYKCGKQDSWGKRDDPHSHHSESWHQIRLGRMGYGSNLDGSDINFTLCDKCLCNLVDSFTEWGKESVHNSGSNYYLKSDEDEYDPETDPSLEDVDDIDVYGMRIDAIADKYW
jgi:hypothetical protein